jgi:hypothetical protein
MSDCGAGCQCVQDVKVLNPADYRRNTSSHSATSVLFRSSSATAEFFGT